MKRSFTNRIPLLIVSLTTPIALATVPVSALAKVSSTANDSNNDQAQIQKIISRGDTEIGRRLTTLNTLSNKISSAKKLTVDNKTTLTNEVNDAISGLTDLKTKLDADTTVSTARTDAQSIIDDYRIYALVVPKVNIVKTADDQQIAEASLTDLSAKLQTRINSAKAGGKDVTALQTSLNDLKAKTSAALAISTDIESSAIILQPSDYNTNHSVLSGYRDQLKTAQTNVQAAVADGKSIAAQLKQL
jgi:hypothetical protein